MEDITIFGKHLIDFPNLGELLFLFTTNFFFLLIIVRFIYMRLNKSREHVFTFVIFNLVIFFLCIMLSSVKLKVGFAFGLFAILSILRYRTETIPIKEMTFMFVCITLAVINALASDKVSILELVITNAIIAGSTYALETIWFKTHRLSRMIRYEKIENIKPQNKDILISDLKERTGLNVLDVDVETINFMTDTAQLKVYYSDDI